MAKKNTEESLILTDKQMIKLELGTEKQKNATQEARMVEMRMQLIKGDVELLKAHIKLKEAMVRELQRSLPDYKNKVANLKDDEKDYLKDIKKELGIKAEKWGYDPDSGEVIMSEEDT